jgi:hypothetical protein
MGEEPLPQGRLHEGPERCSQRTGGCPRGGAAAGVPPLEPGRRRPGESRGPGGTPFKETGSHCAQAEGPRGRHRGHRIRPAQSGLPRGLPSNRGRPACSSPPPSRSNAARPQPVRGQPCLDPRGLPGLIQPAGLMDAMQRLALMMAVMILGAPQVYSCNIGAGLRTQGITSLSDVEICPMVVPSEEVKTGSRGEPSKSGNWVRLQATHCQETQLVLTFLCGPDGHSRAVSFEKFRQPCRVEAAACKEAARTWLLKVGKMEQTVVMNRTRSHMGGDEDCPQGCGQRIKSLDRKVTQILLEVLIEKEWIWWSKTAKRIATTSGKIALVRENGQVVMEDGLRVWEAPSHVRGGKPSSTLLQCQSLPTSFPRAVRSKYSA